MKTINKLFALFAILTLVFVLGCDETTENADVYDAQDCLNRLSTADESNPAALQVCLNKLGSANSPQALALECSIRLMQGGLTTSKIINSFKLQDDPGYSGESGLILTLAYKNGSPDNLTAATNAQQVCKSSGQQGLIGIAGMMVTGTVVAEFAGLSDNPSPGAISTALSNCAQPSGGGGCSSAQKQAIAQAAVSIADDYCGTENDSAVCVDFNTAVQQNTTNGVVNSEALADAILGSIGS